MLTSDQPVYVLLREPVFIVVNGNVLHRALICSR